MNRVRHIKRHPARSADKTAALRSARRSNLTPYVAPTAMVLGSGFVAALGMIMREQLRDLAHTARVVARDGLSLARRADLERMLGGIGLQRKRGFATVTALPSLGGFALGAIAGAGGVFLLGPWLQARMWNAKSRRVTRSDDARPNSVPQANFSPHPMG